jgi:cobalt/nickel transport protein
MVLDAPTAFTVTHEGETTALADALSPAEVMGAPGYTLDYPLTRPGTYVFAMEPQPYWEPAEDSFITHYT